MKMQLLSLDPRPGESVARSVARLFHQVSALDDSPVFSGILSGFVRPGLGMSIGKSW